MSRKHTHRSARQNKPQIRIKVSQGPIDTRDAIVVQYTWALYPYFEALYLAHAQVGGDGLMMQSALGVLVAWLVGLGRRGGLGPSREPLLGWEFCAFEGCCGGNGGMGGGRVG